MGKELFDNMPNKVADLLSDVKNGYIGLQTCSTLLYGNTTMFVNCSIQ